MSRRKSAIEKIAAQSFQIGKQRGGLSRDEQNITIIKGSGLASVVHHK
jgi:hypothetical protein